MTPYSALPQDFWNLEMADVNITRTVEDERLVRNVETIQFCFFCITLTVHLTIIWALFDAHSRKFQELMSSFFKLCLSTAGIDICEFFAKRALLLKIPKHRQWRNSIFCLKNMELWRNIMVKIKKILN